MGVPSSLPWFSAAQAAAASGSVPSPGALGPTFGTARNPASMYDSLLFGYGGNSTGIYRQEPPIQYPDGPSIYVNGTTGNDSTGTGTLALPYKTITKGLSSGATANPAGNFRVLVAAGTYGGVASPEANNRWILAGSFTNFVSIESLSGEQDVTLVDNESAGTNTGCIQIRNQNCVNIQIKNFIFTASGIANTNCLFNYLPSSGITVQNIQFVSCEWLCIINSTARMYAHLFGATDFACTGISFIGGNYTSTGSGTLNPAIASIQPTTQTTANQPFGNIGFYRNTKDADATYDAFGIAVSGTTNFVAVGNSFNCKLYGFCLGQDSTGNQGGNPVPQNTNFYVAGNSFTANNGASTTGGHGSILGNASNTGLFEFNIVNGSVQGIVSKSSAGTSSAGITIRRNFVTMTGADALGGGLNCKATTYSSWLANDVYVESTSQAGFGFEEEYDSTVPAIKSGNNTLVGNSIFSDGASMTTVDWNPTLQSTGGATSNYNVYKQLNSSTPAIIRGTTCVSVAAMQAAWASAGLTGDLSSNDSNSQFNTSGSRDDVTFTGLASTTYYCRFTWADGRVWNGISLEPYNASAPWRSTFYLPPTSLAATTYARPVPFNLGAGSWSVSIFQQLGALPNADDALVSGPTALSYAS